MSRYPPITLLAALYTTCLTGCEGPTKTISDLQNQIVELQRENRTLTDTVEHAFQLYVLPNSRLMMHQPLLGNVMEGSATDLAIEAEEILRLRSRIYSILSAHTGQDPEQIEKDCDRNKWLSAPEAIDYGLADIQLERMLDLPSS